MNETKTCVLYFRADEAFKTKLDNFQNELNLTMSGLIRSAVEHYIDHRIKESSCKFIYRTLDLFLTKRGMTLPDALPLVTTAGEGMGIVDQEAWANRTTVTDELFEKLIDSKLRIEDRKAVTA